MCGIVSAISRNNVVPFLLDGLHRLEYRGYDSAGIAVINDRLQRVRAVGRVVELEKQVGTEALAGDIGIAHTRWATHGVPSERNAHPHVSAGVSVVHNGIIENFEAVRATLAGRGYRFLSDTDTEVIAHLVHWHLQTAADLATAVRRAMAELVGAYAIAVISDGSPTRLVVARHGAPLLLGIGEGEQFAASDAAALIRRTNRIVHLEDGDCAELTLDGIRITDAAGNPVTRPEHLSQLGAAAVERGAYHHYMQKEIFEQPAALAKTLEMVSHASTLSPGLFGAAAAPLLERTTEVTIVACGTSYHAGMTARYWIERLAGIPCTVEIASEYRYREAPGNAGKLLVCISQSGETADTIAALKYAQSLPHCGSLSVCNVPESTLARAADLCFLTRAGPEIGVASTKAFTTQLAALLLFSAVVAKLRGRLPAAEETALLAALRSLPAAVGAALRLEAPIKAWAQQLAHSEHALFLGRGVHYPIAMEGALKLKEISYIHAEAYAAGELKHGPLALVTREMPVIALAPRDALIEKLKSNLNEVRARGGELYVLADADAGIAADAGTHVLSLPAHAGLLSPIVYTVPLQLLAYYAALERNNDVDKPRNLAKSVTVE